ncbi:MAG TPA: prolyl oligopeptidase family serine peptidase [Silvibacterium sp.]|nr:prolyl oligopeptidase family serine peptidase [Silvibacterium sp.]
MKAFRTSFLLAFAVLPLAAGAQTKPSISLDEFMNASEITDARIAADGSAAVVAVSAPDWQQNRFNENLWLWSRKDGKLLPLTHSGHDSSPAFSPDGHYIAFLSDRTVAADDNKDDSKDDDKQTSRVWIIPVTGGEPFPLYREKLDAHAFAWSADGASIDFSAAQPLSKEQEDANKAEWKDVIRWREQERSDILIALPVASAIHESTQTPPAHPEQKPPDDKPVLPRDAQVLAHSAFEIDEIAPSLVGDQIAFETGPISHRLENPADSELFLVPAHGGETKQLTHNLGLETHLTWGPGAKRIYFAVRGGSGSIEGPYRDVQGRIYVLDPASGAFTRLGSDFTGSWEDFTVTSGDKVLATGLTGTEQHLYRIDGRKYEAIGTQPGNYARVNAARDGQALIFTHSTINDPTQVFFADGAANVTAARAFTSFNPLFAERAQVEWQPYQWKSADGTPVEGVLIYPPGKKGAKNLRMLTFIHGGPEDADGNRFGSGWYDWATLAAANGWLVFRPNYRGSTGYGDDFMLLITPHLVSGPGIDILSGVDSLVKDGIADPNRLAIGGYSYGGYMTNWLITQTPRFKAAVTGAGAVEHAANWGNDDLTWDDAWYLSGTPWEKPEIYQSEAALFQLNKVTTPTHIVGGNADVRVSYLEQVLLERALERLNVPHTLLVFPGENHPLDKNPWHGYVKVREELKWLDKYVPQ